MLRTWVVIYAIDAEVTCIIPWIRAFPDRVALFTLSTELGEVNTCLKAYAYKINCKSTFCVGRNQLTEIRIVFLNSPFHGSSRSKCPAYKNVGHWSPGRIKSPLRSFSLILSSIRRYAACDDTIAYWGSDQSIPAGQSRAPVRSWWNPRSILTFRARGGVRDWPDGTIQSRILPFKLFVSSERELDTPFWSYEKKTE